MEAVCSRYGLDKAMVALPAKAGQAPEAKGGQTQAPAKVEAIRRPPEPRADSGKAAERNNKQKGGKRKHGKAEKAA